MNMADSVQDIIDKIKENMQKKLDDSTCETRQPTPGQPPGYDPENPPPDPNAPLWKKIARIILNAFRAGNPGGPPGEGI